MSLYIIFKKSFYSTVANTWCPFHDALTVCPHVSFIPLAHSGLKHTGDIITFASIDSFPVEEGSHSTKELQLFHHQPQEG